MMDLGDSSVCEECAMICIDIYSDNEDEEIVVYGDQGICLTKYKEQTGIFVGYADDHAGKVYRFINVQTKKIILSRDVQWLNLFWKQYKTRNNDSRNIVEEFFLNDQAQQTRHLQPSKRTIKNYGCTSSSTFERNV